MRCLRTTRSATSRPCAVRIASLCSPRSTRPSASSRFSISPADARETPSMSATRTASVGRALRLRLVLADRKREEVDRLEIVVDRVPSRHVRDDFTVARFASVVPLVSARALAHPFTYLADGLEKGAVVSVRFGRASRRGVVVGLEDEAPPEVEPVAVEGVLGVVPAPLVDLALWVADYYGSTPARALGLVAPATRARRHGARRRQRERGLPGRGGARRRRARPRRRRWPGSPRRWTKAEGPSCSTAPPGAARPRSTCAPARTRSRAGSARSSSSPRSRSPRRRSAASAPASASAWPSSTRRLTEAERRDERERIASGEAPIVVGARSAVFAPGPAARADLRRRGARRLLQAGVGPALRRPHRRRQARRARGRRRGLRERDAAPGELGAARAPRARRTARGPAPVREDRRPSARGRLPALGAAPGRARQARRRRGQGDPAPEPARGLRPPSTAGPAG